MASGSSGSAATAALEPAPKFPPPPPPSFAPPAPPSDESEDDEDWDTDEAFTPTSPPPSVVVSDVSPATATSAPAVTALAPPLTQDTRRYSNVPPHQPPPPPTEEPDSTIETGSAESREDTNVDVPSIGGIETMDATVLPATDDTADDRTAVAISASESVDIAEHVPNLHDTATLDRPEASAPTEHTAVANDVDTGEVVNGFNVLDDDYSGADDRHVERDDSHDDFSGVAAIPTPPTPPALSNRPKMFDGGVAVICTVDIMKLNGSLGVQLAGGATDDPAPGSSADGDDVSVAELRRLSQAVFVKSVRPEGAADQSGALRVGDQILAVNGVSIEGASHDHVVELFMHGGDILTIKFARAAFKAIPDVMVKPKKRTKRGKSGSSRPQSSVSPGALTTDCNDVEKTISGSPVDPDADLDAQRLNSSAMRRLKALVGDEEEASTPLHITNAASDSSSDSDSDDQSSYPRTPSLSSFSSVTEIARLNQQQPKPQLADEELTRLESRRRCGWMSKRGGGKSLAGRKSWKRRFFVLQDSMLFYYKPDVVMPDNSGVIPGSTAAGYINLASQCKVSKPSKQRICLQASERNYFFICDSPAEAQMWEQDIATNLKVVKAAALGS